MLAHNCTAGASGRALHNDSLQPRRHRWHRRYTHVQASYNQRPGPPTNFDAAPARPPQYAPPASGAGRPPSPPPPPTPEPGQGGMSSYTKALIAAAFVTGLGAGVYFDSEITLHPSNVASTEIVDRRTPNSELCMAYGYSAMVFDQRVYVSYNPFNVYVTQPEVKPGCVLRRSNFGVLEKDKLVDSKESEACKQRMNTFAFVGDLADKPQISCVYHSEEAENQYLMDPKNSMKMLAAPAPGAEGGVRAGAGAGQ